MQIKKQTDQSIRILVYLSNRRKMMVGQELAGLVGASVKYLPYIMQQLRLAGLVSSSSGTSGGYALAKSAKEITIFDVMCATRDEPQIGCYTDAEKNATHFGKSDVLLKNYDFLQEIAIRYFKSVTIWDLSKPDRLQDFYSRMAQVNNVLETEKPSA